MNNDIYIDMIHDTEQRTRTDSRIIRRSLQEYGRKRQRYIRQRQGYLIRQEHWNRSTKIRKDRCGQLPRPPNQVKLHGGWGAVQRPQLKKKGCSTGAQLEIDICIFNNIFNFIYLFACTYLITYLFILILVF